METTFNNFSIEHFVPETVFQFVIWQEVEHLSKLQPEENSTLEKGVWILCLIFFVRELSQGHFILLPSSKCVLFSCDASMFW